MTIIRCRIDGFVDCSDGGSVTITDTTVAAGEWEGPAVGYDAVTMLRCDVSGGQHSAKIDSDADVRDCYLHDQWNDPTAAFHNNAFISNGGTNGYLQHNTLQCDEPDNGIGGGPTADASIFGDDATPTGWTFDDNLFRPTTGGYGGSFGWNPGKPFGDNPIDIVVINNVFVRGPSGQCGVFGSNTSFKASEPTNVWANNRYDDGTLIDPA